jgi:hypothetical protein
MTRSHWGNRQAQRVSKLSMPTAGKFVPADPSEELVLVGSKNGTRPS